MCFKHLLIFIPILGRFSFWHIFFRLKPPTREQFVLWCGICCLCLFRMQKPQLCKTWIVEGFSSSFTNQIRFGARILCTFLFFSDALGCGFKIDTWISSYVLAIAMFDNLQLLSTFLDTMIHLDFVHFVTTWQRGQICACFGWLFPGLWLFYCSSPSQWDWKNGCFSVSRSCISKYRGPCHWLHPALDILDCVVMQRFPVWSMFWILMIVALCRPSHQRSDIRLNEFLTAPTKEDIYWIVYW